MGKLIKENRIFYLLFLIWMLVVGIYLLDSEKGKFSLWLNDKNSPALDIFFRYATWIGDGYTVGIVCLFLLLVKLKYGITTSLVSFTSAFFVSLLKKTYNEPRPVVYFEGTEIHFVEGLTQYQNHSFPSGHTGAAFTMFLLLTFFVRNKIYSYLFFLLAVLVAISRVYLMQHFLVDVYIGSLCGVVFTTILYYLIMKSPLFRNKKWPEISVLKRGYFKGEG